MKRPLLSIIFGLVIVLCTSNVFSSRLFNGTTDVITGPGQNSALDITGSYLTISAWIYPVGLVNQRTVMAYWDEGTGVKKFWFTVEPAAVRFFTGGGCGVGLGSTFNNNTWYHIGMVNDNTLGSGGRFYVNGAPSNTACNGYTYISQNTSFTIGSRLLNGAVNLPWPGRIAEVGVWNVPLTDNEMLTLASGVPPNKVRPISLKGYFPLYGQDSPERDYSGNAASGTLTGTAIANHCPCSKSGGASGPTH